MDIAIGLEFVFSVSQWFHSSVQLNGNGVKQFGSFVIMHDGGVRVVKVVTLSRWRSS